MDAGMSRHGPLAGDGPVAENDGVPVDEEGVRPPGYDPDRIPGDEVDPSEVDPSEVDAPEVDLPEVDAADAVLLSGFLSMLGEVLARIDRRLDAVHATLAGTPVQLGPDGSPAEDPTPMVLAGMERLQDRLDRLEAKRETAHQEDHGTLLAVFDRLEDRLDRLEAKREAAQEEEHGTLLAVFDRLEDRLDRLEPDGGQDGNELVRVAATLERLEKHLEALQARSTGSGRQDAAEPGPEVRVALERLEERLERLEATSVAAAAMEAALARLDDLAGAVDTIGYGLASMADIVTSAQGREEGPMDELPDVLRELRQGMADLRRELPGELAPHDVDQLREAVGRLEQKVESLRGQPGPGAALAMVAAGLAERFEERTQALTEVLDRNAAYARQLWERVEGVLDGGGFDELAVGEALEHLIDNQELVSASIQQVLASVQDREAAAEDGVGTLQGTLDSLSAGLESVERRVDDVRRRLAALATALESAGPRDDTSGQGPSSLGRRAGQVGRRLAADIALRSKEPLRGPRRPS